MSALGSILNRRSIESSVERLVPHGWRWQIKPLIGLAELSYTTGDYQQALRYVEEGNQKEAQRTSSKKYITLGWALRGKIPVEAW